MRTYKAFFSGKSKTFEAESLYAAKLKAIDLLKVPKSKQGLLAVVLADVPLDTGAL